MAIDEPGIAARKNLASTRYKAWIAATYALNNQSDEARWGASELELQHPDITISRIKESAPFQNQTHVKKLVDGLTIAVL